MYLIPFGFSEPISFMPGRYELKWDIDSKKKVSKFGYYLREKISFPLKDFKQGSMKE